VGTVSGFSEKMDRANQPSSNCWLANCNRIWARSKSTRTLNFPILTRARKELDPEASLWSTLCPSGGDHIEVMGKSRHVCGYLKDFLFDPEMARHSVKTLSGGQKNRLLLAKVLADPKSFLILDEPTNDLDMDTLDMLEEIIANYQGTLILVSHDRDFLDQTVSKILAFEGDGVIDGCIGGYSDYLEMVASRRTQSSEPKSGVTSKSGTSDPCCLREERLLPPRSFLISFNTNWKICPRSLRLWKRRLKIFLVN
jgi:hypothetical protein